MTKTGQKFISIFFFAALLILFCSSFSVVEGGLEIGYPTVPGAETPGEKTKLPEYIKYIFNFSVIIAGILAFAVIVYGGIVYLISAGDPTKIGDAKSRMFGGIAGLVLLLMTYLILTTINPELTIFKEMEPLEPVDGVYLCETEDDCSIKDDPDKRRHYAASAPKIKDFEPRWIKFIDDTNELSSVFVYNDEGYEGDIKEIPNTGADTISSIPLAKSIEFLWNRPGIYLYEKTGFGIDERPPLYLSGSTANLSTWDNKTQSFIIKHSTDEIAKGVVLFTNPDFNGNCGIVLPPEVIAPPIPDTTLVEDLSAPLPFPSTNIIGNDELSSIHMFTVDTSKEPSGNVVFYDSIDCKGNSFSPTLGKVMTVASFDTYGFDKRVLSFEINGPYIVIIMTTKLGEYKNRICQLFKKPSSTNCWSTLKGESVYDPNPDSSVKPRAFFIVNSE